jgi:predicted DNA-binding protein
LKPIKSETLSVRLPDDVKRELGELARTTKRSRSFIVNEAVASFVRERANYLTVRSRWSGLCRVRRFDRGSGYSAALFKKPSENLSIYSF